MAIDRTDAYYTSTYQGRYGEYTVTIYGPDPGPGSPTVLTMAAAPDVAFGEVEKRFGGGLIASSMDLSFVDPAGVIDAAFGDSFTSEDWEVQVTGPDGLGGTWGVRTRPMQGEDQGSHSPLVTPDAPVVLGTHDGMATLADIDGSDTQNIGLENIFARLWEAMPGAVDQAAPGIWDMKADWPITATEQTDGLVSRWRFTGEITGDPDAGDFGTIEDQLLALCETATLSIYQPTDAPGTWEIRTRSRVGSSGSCSLLEGDGDQAAVSADTWTDRTTALPSYTADDAGTGAGRVRRVSLLRMSGTGQVVYETPAAELGDFDEERVELGRFVPTTGLRIRFPESRTEYVDGAGTVTLGTYRLELVGDTQTYYGPDWATSTQTMSPGVTTVDIPATGALALVLVGADDNLDTDNDAGTPDETVAAVFAASNVSLEDAAGDPITDYSVSIGAPGGEAIDVELLPAPEVYDGAAWVTPTGLVDDITGGTCGTMPACTAAIRLSQHGANLRHMVAEVTGLHGPQSRFTLQGTDNGNTASPFSEDVTFIAVGGEPNLDAGWTLLSLVSAAEV